MKNILLLTDFSKNSENSIEYALHFFKKDICRFYVMYVHKMGSLTTDDLMLSSNNSSIYESIIEGPKQKIKELINGFEKKPNSKHRFESIVDFDDFTDAIKQTIKLKNIDLIVMGSNGKTGAKEIIFGSNTLNVIRKVKCTTLVIPENCSYELNKEILLPLDCTETLHGKGIIELHEFIKTYHLNLNVLRINSIKNHCEYEFYDQSNLTKLPHKYFVINEVPVHYATSSFVQLMGIGLTTIVVHKEKFFERFVFGSSTTRISNTLNAPLLILHDD
jgi:nucleotide-binding universal stress UspA family protein